MRVWHALTCDYLDDGAGRGLRQCSPPICLKPKPGRKDSLSLWISTFWSTNKYWQMHLTDLATFSFSPESVQFSEVRSRHLRAGPWGRRAVGTTLWIVGFICMHESTKDGFHLNKSNLVLSGSQLLLGDMQTCGN